MNGHNVTARVEDLTSANLADLAKLSDEDLDRLEGILAKMGPRMPPAAAVTGFLNDLGLPVPEQDLAPSAGQEPPR